MATLRHCSQPVAGPRAALPRFACAAPAALQVIIDSVVGAASPVRLAHTPISASLLATLDGAPIKRSRTAGFDYRAAANSLVFINVKYSKGSVVVASYKRW